MIVGRGRLKEPGKAVVLVTVETTVDEMIEIRDFLKKSQLPYWPFGKFIAVLTDVADQVEKTAYANVSEDKENK